MSLPNPTQCLLQVSHSALQQVERFKCLRVVFMSSWAFLHTNINLQISTSLNLDMVALKTVL